MWSVQATVEWSACSDPEGRRHQWSGFKPDPGRDFPALWLWHDSANTALAAAYQHSGLLGERCKNGPVAYLRGRCTNADIDAQGPSHSRARAYEALTPPTLQPSDRKIVRMCTASVKWANFSEMRHIMKGNCQESLKLRCFSL